MGGIKQGAIPAHQIEYTKLKGNKMQLTKQNYVDYALAILMFSQALEAAQSIENVEFRKEIAERMEAFEAKRVAMIRSLPAEVSEAIFSEENHAEAIARYDVYARATLLGAMETLENFMEMTA